MDYPAEDQYRSMLRSFRRIGQLASNHGPTGNFGHDARDHARDFFLNCFHLKDWLKKHPGIHPSAVEAAVASSRPLSVAADIANSWKHAGLDRPPRTGAPIVAINTMLVLTIPIGMPEGTALGGIDFAGRNPKDGDSIRFDRWTGKTTLTSTRVTITVGTEVFQCYDLAQKCIADWDRFLKDQGLNFSVTE